MRSADFSVRVNRRKASCVLDTALLLGRATGPSLALRLASVVEPWLPRAFWQALDASELLMLQGQGGQASVDGGALARWLALRETTDMGSWVLRWIGDRYAESQIQDAGDMQLVDRYEALAESLAAASSADAVPVPLPWSREGAAAWCAFDADAAALDALALSATLDGAAVLCPMARGQEPELVQAARRRLGPRLQPLDGAAHPLFAAERRHLTDALAMAGLVPMVASMPGLAVVHAWLPEPSDGDDTKVFEAEPLAAGAWAQATLWWYPLHVQTAVKHVA